MGRRGRKLRLPQALQAGPEDHILRAGDQVLIADPVAMEKAAHALREAVNHLQSDEADVHPRQAASILARFFFWARLWPDFAPVLESAYETYIFREAMRLAANCRAFRQMFGRNAALPSCYGSAEPQNGPPFGPGEEESVAACVRLHRIGHEVQVSYRLLQSALAKLRRKDMEPSVRQMAERQAEEARKRLERATVRFKEEWRRNPAAAAEYASRRWTSRSVRRVLDVTGVEVPGRKAPRTVNALESVMEAGRFAASDAAVVIEQGRKLMERLRRSAEGLELEIDEVEGIERILEGEDEAGSIFP